MIVILLLLSLFFPKNTFAQVSSTDIAQVFQFGTSISNGTLVCLQKGVVAPCSNKYDSGMFGVATESPAGSLSEFAISQNSYYVVKGGITLVRVSTDAGTISAGDFVTSSNTAGVAQKATLNGFVLGQAMEDYSQSGEGLIQVALNIHQTTVFADARSNLLELIREGLSAPVLTPLSVLRYLLAAIVLVVAFVLGFIYFGRMARASVEAVGRNPLAVKTIQLSIVLNILLMFAIFCIGLGLAYVILAL